MSPEPAKASQAALRIPLPGAGPKPGRGGSPASFPLARQGIGRPAADVTPHRAGEELGKREGGGDGGGRLVYFSTVGKFNLDAEREQPSFKKNTRPTQQPAFRACLSFPPASPSELGFLSPSLGPSPLRTPRAAMQDSGSGGSANTNKRHCTKLTRAKVCRGSRLLLPDRRALALAWQWRPPLPPPSPRLGPKFPWCPSPPSKAPFSPSLLLVEYPLLLVAIWVAAAAAVGLSGVRHTHPPRLSTRE